MAGKFTVAATLLSVIIAVLFLTEVESLANLNVVVPPVPADVVTAVVQSFKSVFSCARYEGYAHCYFRDPDKRDRIATATCTQADVWTYRKKTGPTCHCYKCT